MRWFAASALLVLMLLPSLAAGQGGNAWKRWAILASPEVQGTGVPDLLPAEEGAKGIQWVERDQLDLAAREASLLQLSAAEGARSRIDLGKMIRADVLVLLTLEKRPVAAAGNASPVAGSRAPATQPEQLGRFLKYIITECVYGTRLRVGQIALQSGREADAAKDLAKVLAGVRAQYANGLNTVIGVAPLLSRALTHDYDHLQVAFANIIRSAFLALPGVAVVEIEEVRATQQERQRASGAEQDRCVAMLVEGEFRVQTAAPSQPAQVSIAVKVSDGQRVSQNLQRDSLSITSAAELLRETAVTWAGSLVRGSPARAASSAEQVRFLREQADTFARIGLYEQSTSLREACLLLDENQPEQHRLLLEEYASLIHGSADKLKASRSKEQEALADATFALLRLSLDHLARFAAGEESNLWMLGFSAGKLAGTTDYAAGGLKQAVNPDDWPEYAAMTVAYKQEFLSRISPLLQRRLDEQQYQDVLVQWCRSGWGLYDERLLNQLALLSRAVLEFLPAQQKPSVPLAVGVVQECQAHYHSDAEIAEFIGLLQRSGVRRNELLGRLCGLCREWNKQVVKPTPELRRAVDDFEAEARKEGFDALIEPTTALMGRGGGRWAQYRTPTRPAPVTATQSVIATVEPVTVQIRDERIEMPGLRAERLRSTAGTQMPLSLVPCGPKAEVFWRDGSVFLHTEPGILREVLGDPDKGITAVAWDGESVWVGAGRHGLINIALDGKLRGQVGQPQGLPPCDQGLQIYATRPGRLITAGAFGNPLRSWCALVDCTERQPRVRVFHEATKVPSGSGMDKEIDVGFVPAGLAVEPDPAGGSALLLRTRARALMRIDPETLAVSPAKDERRRYALQDGSWLTVAGGMITHMAPPGQLFASNRNNQRQIIAEHSMFRTKVLPYQNYLYLPSEKSWSRVDLVHAAEEAVAVRRAGSAVNRPGGATGGAEKTLFRELLPEARILEAGVSVLYGLMVWSDKDDFLKVTITEPADHVLPNGPKMIPKMPAKR